MDTTAVFGLQFSMSLVAWSAVMAIFIAPRLARLPAREALLWLSVPHAFRHLGLIFLVPGMVREPLPDRFALPAAFGDLTAGVLALVAMVALHRRWAGAFALVLLFNVVGVVDLANALRQSDVAPRFAAAWYVPTMIVPLLLVTHALMLRRLAGAWRPVTSPAQTA